MSTHKEFMINCGNKMKDCIIQDFNATKNLVSINKEVQKNNPSLGTTHIIRMYIAKMKILNGYLKTDVDYMQKEHEIFKKYASMLMEEYEDWEGTVITISDMNLDGGIHNNEGGFLYMCDIIKRENDLIENFIKAAKKMNLNGLHF